LQVKIADVQIRGMPESLLAGEPHCAPSPVVIAESVSGLLRTLHASESWNAVVSSAVIDRLQLVDSLTDLLSQCRDSVSVDSCKLVTGDTDADGTSDKTVHISDDVIDTDMPPGKDRQTTDDNFITHTCN